MVTLSHVPLTLQSTSACDGAGAFDGAGVMGRVCWGRCDGAGVLGQVCWGRCL